MNLPPFQCYLVRKMADGTFRAAVERLPLSDLPAGDVLIRVHYSSLNYKDALSATGHPGVSKNFPHVPGIDAAGTVVESSSTQFEAGQPVLVHGFDFGTSCWGGYAEYARIPAEWIVPLPAGLTSRESMIYGTAGFTAGICLESLQGHEIGPEMGPIVVTGASGGVGSLAVALLAKAGYEVDAVTGKPAAHEFLTRVGAKRIISRQEVNDLSGNPLLKGRWAGGVETVGGNTLSTVLRSTQRGGCVMACGLAGGADLPITVYPFILRGIELIGIESSQCPRPRRIALWSKLAGPWRPANLEQFASVIGLGELDERVRAILAGQILGRVVVRLVE